ncbi:hypothetical protein [uncultured Cohaesibacter sp.]|uniref:hypothetical protein n=1 Tax=uncultured Cohaesibacter sp. TaxID=1002546 RepID=UPI0029C6400C|nr:hypothetical protein [uncultured Cohaesibacter sp.]
MIAIAMYILLGAFVTLLLTLFVLPLIWRRAVKLTEKRIKAEMPISYSELQAEKDMQRAEQAIKFRGLEVIAEERLEQVANQTMKIDRLRKTIKEKDATIEARLADISELQETLGNQGQESEETRLTLKTTAEELETARKTIATQETAIVALEENAEELESTIGEQKIEIVAQLARIENLKEEIAAITNERNSVQKAKADADGQLNQKTSELERTKEQRTKLQERIDGLQSEIADKDTQIDNLNRQLERAREGKTDLDLADRLAAAESRRVEAEAKVASLSLQLGYQQQAPEDADISTMISNLQSEKQTIEAKLTETTKEAERLSVEIKSMKKEAAELTKNAALTPGEILLRDEIKGIATRITDFAAEFEGECSPIHQLLGKDKSEGAAEPDKTVSEKTAGAKATEQQAAPAKTNGNGNGNGHSDTNGSGKADHDEELIPPGKKKASDPWTAVFSLADRIREMRDRPSDKSASR